jgi:hypothetical protein
MSKRKLVFLFLIVFFLSFPHLSVWEIDKQSRVTEMIDGDSFYISDDEIRLAACAQPDEYDLIIIVRGLGSIDHPIGLTIYEEDATITITATPEKKWRLQNWQKNRQNIGTSDSITFKMSNDIELIVSFEEISPDCMITFNV